MSDAALFAVILYNAYFPTDDRREEQQSEREVEKAARQVADALDAIGFRTSLFPLRQSIAEWLEFIRNQRPDVVVNLCEAFRNHAAYEGYVAALLDVMEIPYTGNPPLALMLCQDKFRAKAQLRAWNLPTADGWLAATADEIPADTPFPLIVKPNAEDASIGIYPHSVVTDHAALAEQIAAVTAAYAQPALVERYIDGREFNVGVLDDPEPRALPVSEITFKGFPKGQPHIVGYDAKWTVSHDAYKRTLPVCPAAIPAALGERLQQLALQAYRVMRMRGYARVDFRVAAGDVPYILEVNPNPDTSKNAGLARALRAADITLESFWKGQIERALRAREERP